MYERIFGYYIKDETTWEEIKSVFTKVSGELKFKLDDLPWKIEYRVPVDETKHKAALEVVDRWKANDPKYNVRANGGKNCSVFAGEVAKAVGLKVPDGPGSKLPLTFMTELRNISKK